MPQAALTPAKEVRSKDPKSLILEKAQAKEEFCRNYELSYSKKTPLVCISYPLTENNDVRLLQMAMEGILEQNLQLAIVGVGTRKYQDYFTLLAEQHPEAIVIVNDSEEERQRLYMAADMLLCPSNSQECSQAIADALNYGVVPLAFRQEGLEDYSPIHEKGNAFLHSLKSHWSLFANLIRALENFKFPYDWKNIILSKISSEPEDDES